MDKGTVTLFWTTESERNNKGFEIQRGIDGSSFDKIGWADGHGTTAIAHSYQHKDGGLRAGLIYYYRLKQVDLDGEFEYSKVLAFIYDQDEKFVVKGIYPNPVTGSHANLEIVTEEALEAEVIIFDVGGKLVYQIRTSLVKGQNQLRLDLTDAPNGGYVVKVALSSGESTIRRLVVARQS